MAQRLAGPGQGLPRPRALYPTTLVSSPFSAPTGRMNLQAGQTVLIPGGSFFAAGGAVSVMEYLDPVTNQWTPLNTSGTAWAMQIESDGQNLRIRNISGVSVAATVGAAGTGYVAGSTVVTPSAGNSQWQAIVGGAVASPVVTVGGSGYSMVPLVFIAAPPTPGVAATAHATIAAGVVTGVVIDLAGAGYTSAPVVMIVPNPNDPNITGIRPASATIGLAAGGGVTAVLLVNSGVQLAAGPTLAVTGVGTGATAVTTPLTASWVAPAADTILLTPGPG